MMWLPRPPLTATRNRKSDSKGNKETLKKVRKQRNPSKKPPYSSLPSRSSSPLISANLSSRSLSSHSEATIASLSSPATGGPDVLPTSVFCEKGEYRLAAPLVDEQLRDICTEWGREAFSSHPGRSFRGSSAEISPRAQMEIPRGPAQRGHCWR